MQRFVRSVVAGLCLAASASAVMLQQGTREIQLQSRLDFEAAGGSAAELQVGWGVFVNDYLEVGVKGGLLLSDAMDSYRIGGFGEYHFEIETILVPYMGTGLALLMTDSKRDKQNTALVLDGAAGCKLYLVENVALDLQFILSVATDEIFPADDEMEEWDMAVKLGLRFYY